MTLKDNRKKVEVVVSKITGNQYLTWCKFTMFILTGTINCHSEIL